MSVHVCTVTQFYLQSVSYGQNYNLLFFVWTGMHYTMYMTVIIFIFYLLPGYFWGRDNITVCQFYSRHRNDGKSNLFHPGYPDTKKNSTDTLILTEDSTRSMVWCTWYTCTWSAVFYKLLLASWPPYKMFWTGHFVVALYMVYIVHG